MKRKNHIREIIQQIKKLNKYNQLIKPKPRKKLMRF